MSWHDRYQGPLVCTHCGRQWPCEDALKMLKKPFLYPGYRYPQYTDSFPRPVQPACSQ
jgi:hypothetical protein